MASADDEAFWELTQTAFWGPDAERVVFTSRPPSASREVADFADHIQREAVLRSTADQEDDDDYGDDGGGSRVPARPPKTPPQRPGGMALDVPRPSQDMFAVERPSETQLSM